MSSKYSIICLTYKRPHLLEEAVQSILQQTYSNIELIIINDYNSQILKFNHPNVRIFNLPVKFKTLGEKRNFGLKQTTGDYILQLDDDDILLPNYIENINNAIKNYNWLSRQKVIMYFGDNSSKPKISERPLSSTMVFKRDIIEKYNIGYSNTNYDEITPFHFKLIKTTGGIYKALKPYELGYIYRRNIDSAYSMYSLRDISIELQNETLDKIQSKTGIIQLNPHWNMDYNIILSDLDIPINQPLISPSENIEFIENENSDWNKVKPTWENAIKFIEAAKSRGIISTALDALGLNKNSGERVSDEILNQRKLSCFGNKEKNIEPCSRLKYIKDKGYFCGGCGCGQRNLARLDADSPDEYTKLHYPNLECPLKKSGFSNQS